MLYLAAAVTPIVSHKSLQNTRVTLGPNVSENSTMVLFCNHGFLSYFYPPPGVIVPYRIEDYCA